MRREELNVLVKSLSVVIAKIQYKSNDTEEKRHILIRQ